MRRHDKNGGGFWLGLLIALGLAALGYQLAAAAIVHKQFERSVTVKGLSEQEFTADIVIWPIQFSIAGNDLEQLYQKIDDDTAQIRAFLINQGIADQAISSAIPSVVDKTAQQWNDAPTTFRYSGTQTVTVYSEDVAGVRAVMGQLSELGKSGIVFSGDGYGITTQYLFSRLNEVKPQMIEEATRNAREVAAKFASDSQSQLGKIKRASQGQFSITDRDTNNPHIKKVRVVSTIEYYLSD